MPQVVDLRDGLLTAVAALAQVHGGPQPIGLVRQRPTIGLALRARAPGLTRSASAASSPAMSGAPPSGAPAASARRVYSAVSTIASAQSRSAPGADP